MTTPIKKQRDWMDYANLISSVGQNLQLASIHAEQQRGNRLAALNQNRQEVEAATKRDSRNLLWNRIQTFEKFKQLDNNAHPVHAFIAIHRFTLPFTADDLDDWDDKKRVSDFLSEVSSVKGQLKAKLTPEQLQDAHKAVIAAADLKSLNRYIIMERLSKEHGVTLDRLKSEIVELMRQKNAAGLFDAKASSLKKQITEKQSALSAIDGLRKFEPMMNNQAVADIIKMAKEQGLDSVAADFSKEADSERAEHLVVLNNEYLDLVKQFREVDSPISYRNELVEAVRRCWGMNSVREVEDFILGEDNLAKLGDINESAPPPMTAALQIQTKAESTSVISQTSVMVNTGDVTAPNVQKKSLSLQEEWRVSNPSIKALGIWTCRIIGILGCIGGIGTLIDAITGKAGQDDLGTWGSIGMIFLFAGITVCGFWPRKQKNS